jgi:hypothetical protein
LTYRQFLFLHKSADEQLYQQNKFLAAIHGIDTEEESKARPKTNPQKNQSQARSSGKNSSMLFGDPADYASLSDEERTAKTKGMLSHWQPMGDKLMASAKPKYEPR